MELSVNSGTRTLAPEGTHLARCIRIIDLGTQTDEFEGKEIKKRKLKFSFELVGQTFIVNEGEDNEKEIVFTVHKEYTASLNPKATLAKDIAAWLGKKVEDTFIIESLLGKECQVSVTTQSSKANKEYSKVTGVMGVPAKMKVPRAENELVFFSMDKDDFDESVFEELPDFLKETICDSPEAKKLGLVFKEKGKQDDEDESAKAKGKGKGKPAPAPAKGKGKGKVPF